MEMIFYFNVYIKNIRFFINLNNILVNVTLFFGDYPCITIKSDNNYKDINTTL